MAEQTPTPEVKPEVTFIYDLLKEIQKGDVRIPGFQRPFVWRRDQMLELLYSVYSQYPIGSILLWEPSEVLRTSDWVGPVQIPKGNASAALVLDGQQRLSTLAGVLVPLSGSQVDPRDEDPPRWNVWFNADDRTFEHLRDEARPAQYFPLRKLMDTVEFLNECQALQMRAGDVDKSRRWIGELQRLSQVFQSYKVPVIRIRHTNLTQAVEIFARLNSKGQRMSADQMASALVYDETFDLASHIDDLCARIRGMGFGDVDRPIVLRMLLACLDEDVYKTDWTRLTKEKRPDVAQVVSRDGPKLRDAVEQTIRFLQECGVFHERLLPYAMQLVVLVGFFFKRPQPTVEQRRLLRRWFWVSSFTGWGGGGNPSRVGGLVKEFANVVAKNDVPTDQLQNMRLDEKALPFPKSFDTRSARVRALLLVLLQQKPRGPDGAEIREPWKLIADRGPSAIGHVVYRLEPKELVSSPGNRIVAPEEAHRRQGKAWLAEVQDAVLDDVLRSHAIPRDAHNALMANDPAKFVGLRQSHLEEIERTFMNAEHVTPPDLFTAPELSPIDADDEPPTAIPME
jgi:hypothetical protein